jgi:hypothetical protein
MSDITMLVAIAALQEGILPAFSFLLLNYTTADVICEVILNLALNTQRKHKMYPNYIIIILINDNFGISN